MNWLFQMTRWTIADNPLVLPIFCKMNEFLTFKCSTDYLCKKCHKEFDWLECSSTCCRFQQWKYPEKPMKHQLISRDTLQSFKTKSRNLSLNFMNMGLLCWPDAVPQMPGTELDAPVTRKMSFKHLVADLGFWSGPLRISLRKSNLSS